MGDVSIQKFGLPLTVLIYKTVKVYSIIVKNLGYVIML